MSAEHSKVKDPLPIWPPRPHPQGFVFCLDDEGHADLSKKLAEKNKASSNRPT